MFLPFLDIHTLTYGRGGLKYCASNTLICCYSDLIDIHNEIYTLIHYNCFELYGVHIRTTSIEKNSCWDWGCPNIETTVSRAIDGRLERRNLLTFQSTEDEERMVCFIILEERILGKCHFGIEYEDICLELLDKPCYKTDCLL